MTVEETLKVLAVLKANYSHSFANKSKIDLQAIVDLWAEMFADDDYNIVSAAVKVFIAQDTKGFAPSVGQIKEQIRLLKQKETMTEQEAFDRIHKAVCNSGYHAKEEFDKLPPVLQRLAGSPNQLKEWALMDADVFNSVIASNLMRSYKVIVKDEEYKQALPGSVKQLLGDAVNCFKSIEGSS